MSGFDYGDGDGPRATHFRDDGSVGTGGTLDIYGTEYGDGTEQYDPGNENQGYDPGYDNQGGYDPAEHAARAIDNAIAEALHEAGLTGDPEYDGFGREYEAYSDPADSRIENSLIHPEAQEEISDLAEQHPGIRSQAALHAMQPVLSEIQKQHGIGIVFDAEVLYSVYQAAGGDQRFANEAYEEDVVSGLLGPEDNSAFT